MSRRDRPGRRVVERVLDRIEDRLVDAPAGLHVAGDPADPKALEAAALPPEEAAFYARWDGLRIGGDDVEILPLSAIGAATSEAAEDGRLRAGDRVVGEQGRDLLVLPADPWAEGAAVVRVEETGERWPEATGLARFVLAMVAVSSVLYDEEGEFRDGLVGDDGDLQPAVRRKLLRRHLDFDPDAPAPRFRLARSLREAGELRAAAAELRRVLELAPEFAWAHRELAEIHEAQGAFDRAVAGYRRAAEHMDDPFVAASTLACAAAAARSAGDDPLRAELAAAALARAPDLPSHLEASARDQLDRGHGPTARRLLALGLALAPTHLGLLSLARTVEKPL